MIVIPAVDIKDGQCAQLVQGKPESAKYYGDPVEIAKAWEEKGAHLLHVIDLDAALGTGDNLEIIKKIKKAVHIPIQVGGGIRDYKRAKEILDAGIDRIILGTVAIKNPSIVKKLSKKYGWNKLMVAVDSLGGKVVIKGWTEKTNIETLDLIKKLEKEVFGFLVTDVDKEGLMQGVDIEEFKILNKSTICRICAAGGISSNKDIQSLDCIGTWGCVVGKAIYEGKIKLEMYRGQSCSRLF